MPNDTDIWDPGQPPPWLGAYGPAPTAPIDMPPDYVGQGQPQDAPTPVAAPVPDASPSPAPGLASFVPPWLSATPPGPTDAVTGVAPPMPQVPPSDAVSGGAGTAPETPDQRLTRIAADPNATIAERQNAFGGLSPAQRTDIVNNADPKQLATIATAAMSPEELATITVRHQQAQIHEQSAQQLNLAQKADRDAQANMLAYQQSIQRANAATDQLSAEAFNLSQQKIDPKEHGVGHFIASVLTSAVGGAMSQYSGGRNLALEELDKQTDRRIDAQKADIANQWKGIGLKQNLIAEHLQRSGDLYRAQETYRVSQYDRAVSELQTKMQDYDPQGTTALRTAGVIQQIQQQRQQALAAFTQQRMTNFDNLSKTVGERRALKEIYGVDDPRLVGKTDADIGKTLADTDKTKLEALKLKGALGGAAAPEKILPSSFYESQGLPPTPNGEPMSLAAYNAWTEMRKAGGEASKAQTEAESTQNSSTVQNPITKQPLVNKKGKPIVILPTVATEVNDATLATQQTIDSLSDVRRALDADPSTFDRREWARIQAKVNNALPTLAAVFKEKFSAKTEGALKDITNLDYDSYVNRFKNKGVGEASIDATIDTLKRNGDTLLGGKLPDWDGKSPWLDTSKPEKSAETDVDKLNGVFGRVLPEGRDPLGQDVSDAERSRGMFSEHAEALDKLKQIMIDPKASADARKQARGVLQDLALKGKAPTDAVRQAAASILDLDRLNADK